MGISIEALQECITLRKGGVRVRPGGSSRTPSICVIRALLASAEPGDEAPLASLRSNAAGDGEVIALIDASVAALSDNKAQLAKLKKGGSAWQWEWVQKSTSVLSLGSSTKSWVLELHFVEN